MSKPPQCPKCSHALVEKRDSGKMEVYKCANKTCSTNELVLGTKELRIPALFDENMAKTEVKKGIEARIEEIESWAHGGDLDETIEDLKAMKEMIRINDPVEEYLPEGEVSQK